LKVAAGGAFVNPAASHTCVILEDTTIYCWGSGGQGQLGNGSFASKEQPTQVVGLVNISEIAAGGNHTCALKQDGVLYCWGSDESGQLGHGVGQNSLATPKVTLDAVKHIGLGQSHTCAILQDKEALLCWGENFDGELGIGSQADQEVPTPVHAPLQDGVQEVALGDRHTCARRANEIYCFGNDYNGAIGISQFGPVLEPSLVAVPAVKHIEVGRERSAAVYGDMNGLKMWGVPVLGNGDMGLSGTPVEVPVKNIARLALGYDHSCALLMTGEVLCWGENDQGELGTGMDTSTQYKPVQVAFPQ
jgi:alpha-tubulin suppressor-like RCC1 family protein